MGSVREEKLQKTLEMHVQVVSVREKNIASQLQKQINCSQELVSQSKMTLRLRLSLADK